jgi:hypothetical protein
MRSPALFILTGLILLGSCNKHFQIASGVPACISQEIKDNSKNPDWFIGSVEEYEFQGKLVYAFQPDTKRIKDGATTIKDDHCNTLCNVGGFGGPSVNLCNGDNFFKQSVLKRVIWKKE